MKKKIISLVLALLVCCSAAFLFAGCFGTPDHNSTLITNNALPLSLKVKGKVEDVKNLVSLNYHANGDVYYERNSEGKMEEKAYQNFIGTYKKAEDDFKGEKKEVVSCNFIGLDLTTKTKDNETRTLTIIINNATIKIPYVVTES